VFYGPPFPLRDQAGNELPCPETSEVSLLWSSSPSNVSESSHVAALSVSGRGERMWLAVISIEVWSEGQLSPCKTVTPWQ
jgi:hypothetical protein